MGKLKAGAAWCSITPELDVLLEACRADGLNWDGIHEPMRFRCIAVNDGKETAIIGAYDQSKAPFCNKIAKVAGEKYGIKPENFVFAATHNHEGIHYKVHEGDDFDISDYMSPAGRPPKVTSEEMLNVGEWVFEQVIETIGRAIDAMVPAKVGFNIGTSYVNACRDLPTPMGPIQGNNFHGPSDHSLLVIRFDDLEGNTIAMFVNHATHSNALVWNQMDGSYPKINVDLGGGVSRFVEKANKEKFPVLWAQGAAGDQNPIVRSVWRIVEVDSEGKFTMNQHVFSPETNLLQLQGLTSTQGIEVLDLAKNIKAFSDEADFAGADTTIPLKGRKSYSSLGLYSDLPHRDSYENVVNKIQCGDRPEPIELGMDLPMYFRLFRLNDDIAFASVNCEAYTNLGLLTKEIIPAAATAMCTVTYGRVGYIPDAEGQWVNGFGTSNSYAWSGEAANETFEKAYTELVEKVYKS